MKKWFLLLTMLALFSCQKICTVSTYFCKDKTEEKLPIDFTQVDEFPKFKTCETFLDYEKSKLCFETTLHQKIAQRVSNLHLKTEEQITDTITIHFGIDKEGYFSCSKINTNESLKLQLPNLSVEIQEIINGLASVEPAQKRGIPVTSTYHIPLVIKTE